MGLFTLKNAEECHRSMTLIRCVEETIANNYFPDDGPQEMRCPIHLSIGQEAAAVGVIQHLRLADKVYSTHRSHAHYLAKGGSIKKMFGELLGRESGCMNGRGGSMHLKDPDVNFMMSVPIVGSVMPIATGAALANKLEQTDDIVVVYVGDGSLEEGIWHETANFAVLHQIPILFVCENNLYSVYSRIDQRQPSGDISRLVTGHGMEHMIADGNKIDEVFNIALKAIEVVRAGSPCFLSLDTYRHREHCGPNFDDHLKYRPEEEVEEWLKKDPLIISSGILKNRFDFDDENFKTINNFYKELSEDEFSKARESPFPEYSSITDLEYPEMSEGA